MNYLFIDCEVANKHNAQPKICQFGYVLADMNLEVKEQGNFYINPGENEDFSNIEKRRIKLDYSENDYSFYRTQKDFLFYHDQIVSLLNKEDRMIVGWSVSNDLFYLSSECRRYGLDSIDLKAFDVQLLYSSLRRKENLSSLGHAVQNLFSADDPIHNLKEHNSENDALLTLRVFAELCGRCEKTPAQIIGHYAKYQMDSSLAEEEAATLLLSKEQKEKAFKAIPWTKLKKYVFFDIECANTFQNEGKICEFGRVITDSNMQNTSKALYLVNPGKGSDFRFHLLGRKKQSDLHLRYEEDNYRAYYESPEFDYYIDNIEFLFAQSNVLLFGFDVLNDLEYLDYSFRRYGRKPMDVYALDVRKMCIKLLGDKGSLEEIAGKYLPKEEWETIRFHDSQCDAEATMLVLKYLLAKFSSDLPNLIRSVGPDCFMCLKYDKAVRKGKKRINSKIGKLLKWTESN